MTIILTTYCCTELALPVVPAKSEGRPDVSPKAVGDKEEGEPSTQEKEVGQLED